MRGLQEASKGVHLTAIGEDGVAGLSVAELSRELRIADYEQLSPEISGNLNADGSRSGAPPPSPAVAEIKRQTASERVMKKAWLRRLHKAEQTTQLFESARQAAMSELSGAIEAAFSGVPPARRRRQQQQQQQQQQAQLQGRAQGSGGVGEAAADSSVAAFSHSSFISDD